LTSSSYNVILTTANLIVLLNIVRRIEKRMNTESRPDERESATSEKPMVAVADLGTYSETVPRLLERLAAAEVLSEQNCIVLKPNLIEARPAPITTDVQCVEAVAAFCRKVSEARIIIADGAGGCETSECFSRLGYKRLAEAYGVELLDLNHAKTTTLTEPSNAFLKEFHIPEILLDCYLISIPVLKAHSMSGVTLGMKNMIGVAPEKYYAVGGHYKKWGLHAQLEVAIMELNRFRKPDLTLIDAAIGMPKAHLWGPHCDPPIAKLVGSYDPVAADRVGCDLLGKDWRRVEHIRLADGVLGNGDATILHVEGENGRDVRSR
jgi:uncharacterized protein (DUF362 family)